ncbi:MAG: type II toxin-antitoxin system VapC family toxin [Acidimicrobiales bacterium]
MLDANILLRLIEMSHPHHIAARTALKVLRARADRCVVVAQSLNEFWVVATRPTANNGLGKTPAQAAAWLSFFERQFPILPELPLHAEWKRLVTTYGTRGLPAHDARLVAAMKVHGISHLLTFKGKDFARYQTGENIILVDPQSFNAASPPLSSTP